jgi:hypothetical protein
MSIDKQEEIKMSKDKNALRAAMLCLEVIPELYEFEEYGEETNSKVGNLLSAAHYLIQFAYSGSRPDNYAEIVRKGIDICYDGTKDIEPDLEGLGLAPKLVDSV